MKKEDKKTNRKSVVAVEDAKNFVSESESDLQKNYANGVIGLY